MKSPFRKHTGKRHSPRENAGDIARPVSLARALSKLGIMSRSQAAIAIREGNVTVNGAIVRNPDQRCSLSHDKFSVNGAKATEKAKLLVYLMMNKPAGLVTTRSDERGRDTVYSLLGEQADWIYPVGRLDKDTSGLLLFTNDHRFAESLTNPDSNIPKRYLVVLDQPLHNDHQKEMEQGLTLRDWDLRPCKFSFPNTAHRAEFSLTITEGKNRQIRRMMEHFGYSVVSLHREAIGSLTLGTLADGKTRPLTREEVRLFSNVHQVDRNQR